MHTRDANIDRVKICDFKQLLQRVMLCPNATSLLNQQSSCWEVIVKESSASYYKQKSKSLQARNNLLPFLSELEADDGAHSIAFMTL